VGFLDEVLNKVGEEYQGGKGFELGTHTVTILFAEAQTDSKDRNVLKVTVADAEDKEKTAEATLWFHTEGGAKMGVAKVLGLLIHSVGEEKKDAVRELGKKLFGSISEPVKARDVAAKLINDKLIGKEGFAVAEPKNGYTTTKYVDLWHYPAEPQGDKTKAEAKSDLDEITEADLPDFDEV